MFLFDFTPFNNSYQLKALQDHTVYLWKHFNKPWLKYSEWIYFDFKVTKSCWRSNTGIFPQAGSAFNTFVRPQEYTKCLLVRNIDCRQKTLLDRKLHRAPLILPTHLYIVEGYIVLVTPLHLSDSCNYFLFQHFTNLCWISRIIVTDKLPNSI